MTMMATACPHDIDHLAPALLIMFFKQKVLFRCGLQKDTLNFFVSKEQARKTSNHRSKSSTIC